MESSYMHNNYDTACAEQGNNLTTGLQYLQLLGFASFLHGQKRKRHTHAC